ncbi:MAG: dihydrofolate reductase [Sebaldella sp.]|nr:dihydrofolate reductase [Sebaldella sp.]
MSKESKIVLYIAMSLDGYIAKEDGSIEWLENTGGDEVSGYLDFYETIDTIIMGRKTYDQVLTFGEWGYKAKKTYVLTSKPRETKNDLEIEFINEDLNSLVNRLKAKAKLDIWLLGGAKIVNEFLESELIDEYRIAIIPIILGSGIKLFETDIEELLKLEDMTRHGDIVELRYVKNKIKIANFEINNYNRSND